jgi:hypothetical protein
VLKKYYGGFTMTIKNKNFDPEALAESSTLKKPFHIKVDQSYLKLFDQIHAYYQTQSHYVQIHKHNIFMVIVEQHFNELVERGCIETDRKINKKAINPDLNIQQILADFHKGGK